MTVAIKKNAKKREIEEAFKKIEEAKKLAKGKGNIAHLFGSYPDEVNGFKFQKKVRKEWQ